MVGLILAGGESSRIGSPKALLRIGSETFAQRISRIMHQAGIEDVILVAGPHYDEIRKQENLFLVLHNPQHSLGQFSSLQTGLQNLPSDSRFVLVWPVDLPLVQETTIRTLLEVASSKNPVITIPVYENKHGHPVIYNREAIDIAMKMEPTQTGKDLNERFKGRLFLVETEDSGVLIDIDTPEDYKTFVKES